MGVELKRELNFLQSTFLIVGSIIGSGIFVSPKTVLQYTGSRGLAVFTWTSGGILALGGALCYCELGTLFQKSGGEYVYLKQAFRCNGNHICQAIGEVIPFLFVWSQTVFARPASLAIIALTFGEYTLRSVGSDSLVMMKLLAAICIGIFTMINCYSVKMTAKINTTLTALKLITAIGIILSGALWWYNNDTMYIPDLADEQITSDASNWDIVRGLIATLWAYNGWNSLNYVTEEAKDVERMLPKAVFLGVLIVYLVYTGINMSLYTVLTLDEIQTSKTNTIILNYGFKILGHPGYVAVALMVAVYTLGSVNSNLFCQSRLIHSSAREGMLPKMFALVHVRLHTPIPALLLHSFIGVVLIVLGDIQKLIRGFGVVTWAFYTLCFAAVVILRYKNVEKRPFKVWILIPILMTTCGTVIVLVALTEPNDSKIIYQMATVGVVLCGIPVHFIMDCSKQKLFKLKESTGTIV